MANQPPKYTAQIIMAVNLTGAVIIAAIGTFVPSLIGLTGAPALAMQLVFYAVAVIDVAIAFWLRAKIRKARQSNSGGPVQRQ